MKRSMCGLILLAAVTGLSSCKGDPTESFRGTERVIADPTAVFVDQGLSKFVTVQVVDSQGNQLSADFQAQNVGAGITVEEDPTYLETTNGSRIPTSERFIVTGVSPASTSFDVVAGSATLAVPVKVIPSSVAATFSNAAPAQNEQVTITLPTGFKFGPDAALSTDQGQGVVLSFSGDSTAIVALLPPGSTGAVSLSGVTVGFLPGVTVNGAPTEATVTVGAPTPAAGTGSTATAPALPVPPLGGTTGFFDAGTFTAADVTVDGGVGAQYYRLVITEAGDYTITTDWLATSPADIDALLCPSTGCAAASTFIGSGTTHPEQGTLTLAPGTYFIAVVLFAGAAPGSFSVAISSAPTPAP
jgi:hypothetical protein